MCSDKLNGSLVHNDDAIGKLNGAESVRDHNRRAAADKFLQRLMNIAFALKINLARRFV